MHVSANAFFDPIVLAQAALPPPPPEPAQDLDLTSKARSDLAALFSQTLGDLNAITVAVGGQTYSGILSRGKNDLLIRLTGSAGSTLFVFLQNERVVSAKSAGVAPEVAEGLVGAILKDNPGRSDIASHGN